MTSINVLDLPAAITAALVKGKLSKATRHVMSSFSLDTVEDLLLYTPPGSLDDVHSARFKRHQPAKGASSTNYDRLMGLTADQVALAYDQAAAYVFENRIAYGTALDLLQEEQWLSLGDPILDNALGGGGLSTHAITEIAGESAVGKTQLCLQLCLTVQLPHHMGGLDGSAVWLSTEGKFPYSRLESMISHFVSKHKEALPDLNADEIRDNIYFDSMADQETQLHIFNYQLPILIHDSHVQAQEGSDDDASQDERSDSGDRNTGEDASTTRSRKKPIKLIIIDSIANNFRSELHFSTTSTTDPSSGRRQGENQGFRSSILQRSAELCEIGLRLRTLADQYALTVVCVNQVTDVFEGEETTLNGAETSWNGSRTNARLLSRPLGDSMKLKKPALGLVWENTINARVVLQRTRVPEYQDPEAYSSSAGVEPQRTLSVVFSPWAANERGRGQGSGHCRYRINASGVVGAEMPQ
ncbi:DNA repair protein xrcc3 [Dissophora globulifera]|nr:DNA repair protein xrcc3 [Dissophora globulifera]